jgi:hypothetical protein
VQVTKPNLLKGEIYHHQTAGVIHGDNPNFPPFLSFLREGRDDISDTAQDALDTFGQTDMTRKITCDC